MPDSSFLMQAPYQGPECEILGQFGPGGPKRGALVEPLGDYLFTQPGLRGWTNARASLGAVDGRETIDHGAVWRRTNRVGPHVSCRCVSLPCRALRIGRRHEPSSHEAGGPYLLER